jgi:hypothetical protein
MVGSSIASPDEQPGILILLPMSTASLRAFLKSRVYAKLPEAPVFETLSDF